MARSLELNYGEGRIAFEVPETVALLTSKDPEPSITPAGLRMRLHDALAARRLDLSRVAVVVGDKSRLCGYPDYLPVLMEVLSSHGARPDRIKVFIAYGTHARQSEMECEACYGALYRQMDFVHHDCDATDSFLTLGTTQRGTPVLIRKDILATTCLITFGAVSHHYFAGYGGGRKLIFPGLGARSAIYHNHGLFLDIQRGVLAPFCQPGQLDGNPLAADLAEYEVFRRADLAIHGILDRHGTVCDLLVGAGPAFFRTACDMHAKLNEISPAGHYDCVVASAGGFPKDINFIQSHKAVDNAAKFVRGGGDLILLAQCRDGIGSSTFLPWFRMGGQRQAFRELARQYQGNGGTALAMMAKTRRIRIALVCALDEVTCQTIGVDKLTPVQAQERLQGASGRMAVLPNASMLVRVPVRLIKA